MERLVMNKPDSLFTDLPEQVRKKIRKLSATEIIRINTLLQDNLKLTADGLYVEYTHGLNDTKIAQLIGPDINRHHVANLRNQLFGNLRQAYPAKNPDLEARVKELEYQLKELEKTMLILEERLAILEDKED